jgi:hypothetical protein
VDRCTLFRQLQIATDETPYHEPGNKDNEENHARRNTGSSEQNLSHLSIAGAEETHR